MVLGNTMMLLPYGELEINNNNYDNIAPKLNNVYTHHPGVVCTHHCTQYVLLMVSFLLNTLFAWSHIVKNYCYIIPAQYHCNILNRQARTI